jgi:hypothetical protein
MIQAVHEANKQLGPYCLPDLRLVAGVTVRQWMLTPPRHLILTIGPCLPILRFVFAEELMRSMTLCYVCPFLVLL